MTRSQQDLRQFHLDMMMLRAGWAPLQEDFAYRRTARRSPKQDWHCGICKAIAAWLRSAAGKLEELAKTAQVPQPA